MKNLRKELEQMNSAAEMLDFFGISYKNKLLSSNKHQFMRHVKKHMEHCGNLNAYDAMFLFHLYKDILEISYKETANSYAA